jgi:hypothetical protein
MTPRLARRKPLLTLIFACALASIGCVADPALHHGSVETLISGVKPPCRVGELFARTDLFFGRAKPDGSEVTDEEWERFLNRTVTPRFPDGLTVFMGIGQFRDQNGVILREASVLLILLYPFGDNGSHKSIERIRDAYTRAFQQQSVLRVDHTACVAF